MDEHTLMLIKPNAINKIGSILKIIEDNGFTINQMKMFQMDCQFAESFYSIHKDKPFFDILIKFMTSDRIVALDLTKNNAVSDLRDLIGDTDYRKAKIGTVRYLYANDLTQNAVHGSDSVENAKSEIKLVFK